MFTEIFILGIVNDESQDNLRENGWNRMKQSNKKWLTISLIGITLILLIGLGYAIYLYNVVNNSRTEGFETTKNQIESQTSYQNVHSMETYHGENSYHVFYASSEEGEEHLIFLPLEGEERELIVINQGDMVDEETILQTWRSNCDSCKLADIQPAYEEEHALWEVTYHDNNGHFVMDYYAINGEELEERYTYEKMFQ